MFFKFVQTSAKEKLGIKLGLIVAGLIFGILFFFSGLFFFHHKRSLSETMINDNLALTGIFAHNCRFALLRKDENLLKDLAGGLFHQKEIIEVSFYDLTGRLLRTEKRPQRSSLPAKDSTDNAERQLEKSIFNRFITTPSPFVKVKGHVYEFWAPVTMEEGYLEAKSLFHKKESVSQKSRIIGYVRITGKKSTLDKKLSNLLFGSILMSILFAMIGAGIVYLTVKQTISPLSRLTEHLKNFEKGRPVETIPVVTGDEVGKLAVAFNRLAESIINRETKIEKLQTQLRHVQKMEAIGTLSEGIAHDFNNILGAIIGYTELALLSAPSGSEIHHFLDEVFKAAVRAKDLVKQFLTFSRMGSQERQPIRIEPVIKGALKIIRATLPNTIAIRSHLRSNSAFVLSDPSQIQQIMINLCTNAGRAMNESGGVLDVSLDEMHVDPDGFKPIFDMAPGRYQRLTVSDTGSGMNRSVMERIFDPNLTTENPGTETGMRLSVVHEIVKDLGGEILVRSEPGKGTTFEVFFPTIE